ncbi:metal-dependent hydrolase [Candidatus Microgenomates bacterium]|nr:MAG: metal-dependent hydrolase [Candidatus Microgenomates bacterium]
MTGKTHDVIAFASLLTVAAYFPPGELNVATASACVVGNIVGATLPDVDQATNKLWDMLPGGDYLGRVFHKLFLGHRTLTHSLIGVYLVHLLLQFVLPKILNPSYIVWHTVYVSMMIGVLTHLAGDSLTKDGLPLLFPLKVKIGFPPFEAFRITTGKWIENIIVFPAAIAYIFWFVGVSQDKLLAVIKLMSSSS